MVNEERVEPFQLGELHHYPMFMKICCATLNSEWKRSETARMHSLQKSSSSLPVSLVMFVETSKEFLGHARLCRILERSDACFVESVIVLSEKRGRGLGRQLMALVERYASQHGFSVVYLTTKDKQTFYEHLGYTFCQPVTASTSSRVTFGRADKPQTIPESSGMVSVGWLNSVTPPVPPLPSVKSKSIDKHWMMKVIRS